MKKNWILTVIILCKKLIRIIEFLITLFERVKTSDSILCSGIH